MEVNNLKSLISALRAETANGAITPESLGGLLQKIVDAIDTKSMESINITCKTKGKVLYVKGAAALVQAGYTPYIFRFSVKTNHLTSFEEKNRYHGPKRRGWNTMFNAKFVKVNVDDSISFAKRSEPEMLSEEYTTSPKPLVFIREYRDLEGKISSVKVGFGKYTYIFEKSKRLQFGIGFLKPGACMPLSPQSLATNIAPFKVCVYINSVNNKTEVTFAI